MFGLAHASLHIGSGFDVNTDSIVSLDCQDCSLNHINVLSSVDVAINPPVPVLLGREVIIQQALFTAGSLLAYQSRAPPRV